MSRFSIRDIIEGFRETSRYAQLLINNVNTQVEVKYDLNHMEIRNLEDLKPFIRIAVESEPTEASRVEASVNGLSWEQLDKEESEALQIYRLFDPVFILNKVKFDEPAEVRLDRTLRGTIEGTYNITKLPLPITVKKHFEDEGEVDRRIRIVIVSVREYVGLSEMVQKDFPPFTNTITLVFDNYKPSTFV